MNTTGRLKGLQVTAGGTGIMSHAGMALLRALADNTGLTAGLSKALAPRRGPGAGQDHRRGERRTAPGLSRGRQEPRYVGYRPGSSRT